MSHPERLKTHETGGQPVDAEFTFDKNSIAVRTGFHLAIDYTRWETDGAGIVQFGEDVNFYGEKFGYANVVGSFFVEEGKLLYGLFVRGNVTAIDTESSEALPALEP